MPDWLFLKQQSGKLKLTQNNKNNFSIIFTIFGINQYSKSIYKDTKYKWKAKEEHILH